MDWIQTVAGQQLVNSINTIAKELQKKNELEKIKLMIESGDLATKGKGLALLKKVAEK